MNFCLLTITRDLVELWVLIHDSNRRLNLLLAEISEENIGA